MKKKGKGGGCRSGLLEVIVIVLAMLLVAVATPQKAEAGIAVTCTLTLTSGTAVAVPDIPIPVPDHEEWAITAMYADMPTLVTATSVTFRVGAVATATTPTASTPFYYVSAAVNSATDTQLISPVPAATYAVQSIPISQTLSAPTKIWAYTNSGAASGSTVTIPITLIISRVN